MTTNWIAAALAGVLLAGCLRVAPPPAPRPPVALPERFLAAPEQVVDAGELPDAWWRELGDPHLDPLVREALTANPTVVLAASRIAAAEARARIAGADVVPRADLLLDAAHRRQVFVGLPIPGAGNRVVATTATTFGPSLNVSWEVDLWGRIRAGRAAAAADVEASRHELAAARLSLAGQVAKAWFIAVEAFRQEHLARAVVEAWAETRDLAAARYRRGLAPSTDVRLAESNLAQAESLLELRRRQVDAGRRQLEILLGRYPAGAVTADVDLPTAPPAIPAGMPAEVLARRPDLALAEERLAAAGHRVTEARAALYPRLRLTGSAGILAPEITSLLNGDFGVWGVVGSLLQPLFDGGRLRAGVDLAAAGVDEALARYAQDVLRALAEVESALAADTLLARQEEALQRAGREARGSQEVAEARYRRGLVPFLLVLETRRQLDLVRGQHLEVRRQRLTNRVDLLLALGGGVRPPGGPGAP
jgi:outer membrane protein, multidrug efflux system